MIKRLSLGLLALLLCEGCAAGSEQTIYAYNALGRAAQLDLAVDGYIVGIEKYPRGDIAEGPAEAYPDKLQPLRGGDKDRLIDEQNKEFIGATNDSKAMLVTHVVSYFPTRTYLYNAYAKSTTGDLNYRKGYDNGLAALTDDLAARLVQAIDEGTPYSHILLMSMGWNNDQHVSIDRFNRMLGSLREVAAEQPDAGFRPLVIGLTWPSAWFSIEDFWLKKKLLGHLGSYTNKSNDADEIGYSIANWLINHELAQARDAIGPDRFPTVVALGHSMGARLFSRAIFSRAHLKEQPAQPDSVVALFIGLQGAFSARRFVAADSGEGAPYADYPTLSTVIVLTSSKDDRANPTAIWSKHVGGPNGLRYMRRHPEVFNVLTWEADKPQIGQAIRDYKGDGKVLTLDVSEIVAGAGAHNDILDKEMARLIWFCLQQLDQPQGNSGGGQP
jgi:pimeloyl-ACP methyl ester carboxylesterase